ncbi:MAG TPA: CinA family protein [Mycobacteriales bacterium]|jgi:nicotinamide-nucleotide amidase|nr:CinA family protein [Mycobacteriales bacterium]
MSELAAAIHRLLLDRGETVATAESLTGGLVGAALTETPGASATYRGGLIVYATDLKATLAGVGESLLVDRGAVDPDVAAALADGARTRLGSTWGLGLTGVAGPDRQDSQPVGTLHVGVAGRLGEPTVTTVMLSGDRSEIRLGAVENALTVLHRAIADAE